MSTHLDVHGRPLRSLRLSVTDRCNLRCAYCMPEAEYVWLERKALLSFEELTRLVRVFVGEGVSRLRLTGGEPLLRRDLARLVRALAPIPGIEDFALTTNGVFLADQAGDLRRGGLRRVTVSLDTLRPERFEALTRNRGHGAVLHGIARAAKDGFAPLKLDTVVLRGVNDDEIVDLVRFARSVPAEIRFIEYMDVGGATQWTRADVVSKEEILERITNAFGPAARIDDPDSPAPAVRFRLADGTAFGVIASTTTPFCSTCDRSRVTADGTWFHCLYAPRGIDLRAPLRNGASDAEIGHLIRGAWSQRSDRGAEERALVRDRAALAEPSELRANPHLEMHTRGG